MQKYFIWCKWSKKVGDVPDDRDKEWNLVTTVYGDDQPRYGYDNPVQAGQAAEKFTTNWQPGMMETIVLPVYFPHSGSIEVPHLTTIIGEPCPNCGVTGRLTSPQWDHVRCAECGMRFPK